MNSLKAKRLRRAGTSTNCIPMLYVILVVDDNDDPLHSVAATTPSTGVAVATEECVWYNVFAALVY